MNETTTLAVGGMHCDACVASVNRALERLDGVASASASLAAGEVVVAYDASRLAIDDLMAAIEDAGFDAH